MVISVKDTIKHVGISIVTFCAVLISTMFMNYYLDILEVEDLISNPIQQAFYDAQVSVSKLLCMVCGSILMVTSVILLIFYIKQYIDSHKKELGILKALGYSNLQVAKSFWVFGFNVFIGTSLGFGVAFVLMDKFYEMQHADSVIPEFSYSFHPVLLICFVVLPTILFAIIAILYSVIALRYPVIGMIKEISDIGKKNKKIKESKRDRDFKTEFKSISRRSNKLLVFFIMFASLCFASISQASFTIRDYSTDMMGVMILVIGLILSITMMFISVATVIKGNKRSIAMMRVFGYSNVECYNTVLGGYRPLAYIGFIVGTIYQYVLMKVMIEMFFGSYEGFEPYELEIGIVVVTFCMFVVFYEFAMLYFAKKLKSVSIKDIMLES